jgi:hypothetical protein
MQLHGRPGLASNGFSKIGGSEAVGEEGHTIDEVEVLFQVE